MTALSLVAQCFSASRQSHSSTALQVASLSRIGHDTHFMICIDLHTTFRTLTRPSLRSYGSSKLVVPSQQTALCSCRLEGPLDLSPISSLRVSVIKSVLRLLLCTYIRFCSFRVSRATHHLPPASGLCWGKNSYYFVE